MSSALSHSSSRSIATRVMYGVALVALLAFGVAAAASYLRSSQALLTGARATMEGLASLEAQRISGELGRAFDGNEALAHALLAQRAGDGVSRAAASAVIRRQLEAHPEWVGVGTLWEPDAFDGQDAAHAGVAEGHDDTGRFMSYWAWSDGAPLLEALRDYEVPGAGDWYLRPRELKRAVVAEPYVSNIAWKDVLMTTLSTPILDGDEYVGVMTVDFALQSLQERIAKLTPMEAGFVRLLTPRRRSDRRPRRDPARQAVRRSRGGRPAEADRPRTSPRSARWRTHPSKRWSSPTCRCTIGTAVKRFALGVVVPRAVLTVRSPALAGTVVAGGRHRRRGAAVPARYCGCCVAICQHSAGKRGARGRRHRPRQAGQRDRRGPRRRSRHADEGAAEHAGPPARAHRARPGHRTREPAHPHRAGGSDHQRHDRRRLSHHRLRQPSG